MSAIVERREISLPIQSPGIALDRETKERDEKQSRDVEKIAGTVQVASIQIITSDELQRQRCVGKMMRQAKTKGGTTALFIEDEQWPSIFLFNTVPNEKEDPLSYAPFIRLTLNHYYVNTQFMIGIELKEFKNIQDCIFDLIDYSIFRNILKDAGKLLPLCTSYSAIDFGLNKGIKPCKPEIDFNFLSFMNELVERFKAVDSIVTDFPVNSPKKNKEGCKEGCITVCMSELHKLILENKEHLSYFLYIVECLVMTEGVKMAQKKTQLKKLEPYDFPIRDLMMMFYLSAYERLGGDEKARAAKFVGGFYHHILPNIMLRKVISKIEGAKDKFTNVILLIGQDYHSILEKGLAPYSKTPIKVIPIGSMGWTPRSCAALLA